MQRPHGVLEYIEKSMYREKGNIGDTVVSTYIEKSTFREKKLACNYEMRQTVHCPWRIARKKIKKEEKKRKRKKKKIMRCQYELFF